MRILLPLLACVVAAASEPQCVLSDWSQWSECEAPATSRCGALPPMSFAAEKPDMMDVDMGRLRFHGMMHEKERIWRAIDAATQDGSCEECQPKTSISGAMVPCVNGFAGEYNCDKIDLMSFTSFDLLGSGIYNPEESFRGNDIWGWTDPQTNNEYAIMGMRAGTSFVDVTDPVNPLVVGYLNTQNDIGSNWRDMKVIGNFVYIGSEAPRHGMQVFDLTQLRGRTTLTEFQPTVHYELFGQSHNIVANPETQFIYAVGVTSDGIGGEYTTCNGGLHIVDVSNPLSPTFVACYSEDGYTHDAQCVLYNGPDVAHRGKEICFNLNEDTVTIVDVTDKSNMIQLSRSGYQNAAYTHQGWLTEDQTYMIVNDELDEDSNNIDKRTRSYVWDVTDLDNPVLVNTHIHDTTTIDHNLYNLGDLSYMSNYQAGLRIMDFSSPPSMTEVAYFDVYPIIDESTFGHGSWSVYPFFKSGNIIISSIDYGLYVVRPNMAAINQARAQKTHTGPMGKQTRSRDILAKDLGATCGALSETSECQL